MRRGAQGGKKGEAKGKRQKVLGPGKAGPALSVPTIGPIPQLPFISNGWEVPSRREGPPSLACRENVGERAL